MHTRLAAEFNELFGTSPRFVARAPGRIEFIGNHTDYNGGPVLGAAINRSVQVACAPRTDGRRRFFSTTDKTLVSLSAGEPRPQSGTELWVNYPLGVIAALSVFGLKPPEGFDLMVTSDLPAGAGLSSSAALELASALVFLAITDQHPTRETLVQLCRHAENAFVGVPCGILDQAVSAFGQKDHLVQIDCRGPRFARVPFPAGARIWIFNTRTKHALVDGLYRQRHEECLAAAAAAGVSQLSELTPAQFETVSQRMPSVLQRRARHVIEEIQRVEAVILALGVGDLAAIGERLTASHRSSRHLFENSTPELDFLVEELAPAPRVLGARLTGGGFGGAVVALTDLSFSNEDAARVTAAYERRFGHAPDVLPLETADGASLLNFRALQIEL